MKISDVDLNIISNLLNSVPDDMQIDSIDFKGNTYSLKLSASYTKLEEINYDLSLESLIKSIKALENSNT